MQVTDQTRLYIVQFGKPDKGDGWISYRGSDEMTFYVLANSYSQACQKAELAYKEWFDNRPILDELGSLNLPQRGQDDSPVGIKQVKLACDKIVY